MDKKDFVARLKQRIAETDMTAMAASITERLNPASESSAHQN